jgi:hypothetical protein
MYLYIGGEEQENHTELSYVTHGKLLIRQREMERQY